MAQYGSQYGAIAHDAPNIDDDAELGKAGVFQHKPQSSDWKLNPKDALVKGAVYLLVGAALFLGVTLAAPGGVSHLSARFGAFLAPDGGSGVFGGGSRTATYLGDDANARADSMASADESGPDGDITLALAKRQKHVVPTSTRTVVMEESMNLLEAGVSLLLDQNMDFPSTYDVKMYDKAIRDQGRMSIRDQITREVPRSEFIAQEFGIGCCKAMRMCQSIGLGINGFNFDFVPRSKWEPKVSFRGHASPFSELTLKKKMVCCPRVLFLFPFCMLNGGFCFPPCGKFCGTMSMVGVDPTTNEELFRVVDPPACSEVGFDVQVHEDGQHLKQLHVRGSSCACVFCCGGSLGCRNGLYEVPVLDDAGNQVATIRKSAKKGCLNCLLASAEVSGVSDNDNFVIMYEDNFDPLFKDAMLGTTVFLEQTWFNYVPQKQHDNNGS